MEIIKYKKGPLKIIEGIGKESLNNVQDARSDIQINLELILTKPSSPIVKKERCSFELNIPNFLVRLDRDEEVLYKNIHKSIRADIRKATEIDGFSYHEVDNPCDDKITEFALFFNTFAKEKKIPLCSIPKLQAIRDKQLLILTYILDKNNSILCASMLIVDEDFKQVYGLYGVSARLSSESRSEYNRIGRANKYLQWKEIQSAKKRGMDWYNFGGEVQQEKSQGVNTFKKRFGTIQGYDRRIYIPKSIKGIVTLNILYRKWRRNFQSTPLSAKDENFHLESN